MGEAKNRGIDPSGYGQSRRYATIAARAWFIGVSPTTRRECTAGGGGETITQLLDERAALLECPNAAGAPTLAGAPSDDETKMAMARAIALAEDGDVVVFHDDHHIETLDRVAFQTTWQRVVGPNGSGRCVKVDGTREAACNVKKATFLAASGAHGRHDVMAAPSFLKGVSLPTGAGHVVLDDPLTMQIACVVRQDLTPHGEGLALGPADHKALREALDALIAHASTRHLGPDAGRDLSLATSFLGANGTNQEALRQVASRPGRPFASAMRTFLEQMAHVTIRPGHPGDALAKAMGINAARWTLGDLSPASQTSVEAGGPPIPTGAAAITLSREEATFAASHLARIAERTAEVEFPNGTSARFHAMSGASVVELANSDDHSLIAWATP